MFVCQPGVLVRDFGVVPYYPLRKMLKSLVKHGRLPMSPQTANRDSTGVLYTLIAKTQNLLLDF